ncbi:Cell wall biosynthesis/cell cycle regulator smi1 [Sphaceloma murrayae]|uniref:Cell wall biosynthesis/cell cycle regulator smi1 n=1 Tax=Sphaceloma murrayae TaxID=2082308 RepID=A0A2K1R0Z3_9PEZI|nr:Cell wall biosynthesis/cell cycle regulator smi1 [Sphaceloma murrayae]
MDEYQILPENTYDMDEKGFLLGKITKSKRVFPKDLKASEKLLGASQDGPREFITVVATICADGTALPPLLIYDSTSGSIQDSWVQDFNSNEHDAWFTSSPNGWTSDEIGFKWLEALFEKHTQDKARRDWRLLFVDGHGSHVTLKFLEWAQQHKLLVAVYPPHSTHTLQPLDVGCLAPLATYYSQLLEQQTRLSEG